jgi:hypothetical protein
MEEAFWHSPVIYCLATPMTKTKVWPHWHFLWCSGSEAKLRKSQAKNDLETALYATKYDKFFDVEELKVFPREGIGWMREAGPIVARKDLPHHFGRSLFRKAHFFWFMLLTIFKIL